LIKEKSSGLCEQPDVSYVAAKKVGAPFAKCSRTTVVLIMELACVVKIKLDFSNNYGRVIST
jgi:hypothetical protein